VTDANLVLGRLNPNRFLDGGMVLDTARAEAAIQTLVDRLGGDIASMAHGITRIANVEMAGAIARVSLERGRDPREFTLFAYGGAGALHAAELARELSIPRVIIPVMPGIFSALGMLLAELRQDFTKNFMRGLETISIDELRSEFRGMEEDAAAWEAHVAKETTGTRILRFADVRYRGQEFTILVPVLGIETDDAVDEIRTRFETEYALRYGHSFSELAVEIVNLRAVAFVSLAKPQLEALRASERRDLDAVREQRPVYFEGHGFLDTVVVSRSVLDVGSITDGPVIVEEYGATTVVGPDDTVAVDDLGQLVITIGARARHVDTESGRLA
jgi:N-methylhydantoinase A